MKISTANAEHADHHDWPRRTRRATEMPRKPKVEERKMQKRTRRNTRNRVEKQKAKAKTNPSSTRYTQKSEHAFRFFQNKYVNLCVQLGAVVNLMSVDAKRLQDLMTYLPMLGSGFVVIYNPEHRFAYKAFAFANLRKINSRGKLDRSYKSIEHTWTANGSTRFCTTDRTRLFWRWCRCISNWSTRCLLVSR